MTDEEAGSGAYARSTDPRTSHAAADRTRKHLNRLEQEVLDVLKAYAIFMTSLEIAKALGIDKWSVSPRMKPLEDRGLIERGTKLGVNSNGKIRTLCAWRYIRKPHQLSLFA